MNALLVQLHDRRLNDLRSQLRAQRDSIMNYVNALTAAEREAGVTLDLQYEDVESASAEASRLMAMDYLEAHELSTRLGDTAARFRGRSWEAWDAKLGELRAGQSSAVKSLSMERQRISEIRDAAEKEFVAANKMAESALVNYERPKRKRVSYPILGVAEHLAWFTFWGFGLAGLLQVYALNPPEYGAPRQHAGENLPLIAAILAAFSPFVLRLLLWLNATRRIETEAKRKADLLTKQAAAMRNHTLEEAEKAEATKVPPLEEAVRTATHKLQHVLNVYQEFKSADNPIA